MKLKNILGIFVMLALLSTTTMAWATCTTPNVDVTAVVVNGNQIAATATANWDASGSYGYFSAGWYLDGQVVQNDCSRWGCGGSGITSGYQSGQLSPGQHQITFAVQQGGSTSCSKSGSATQTLTIAQPPAEPEEPEEPTPTNTAPIADFSVNCNNLTCDFTDGSFDIEDGTPSYTKWFFGDGTTSFEENPTYTYATAGTYEITLLVMDSEGKADTLDRTVTVTSPATVNDNPTADFTFNCNGLTCTFTDESNDNDGWIVKFEWGFGDGDNSENPNPVHTFTADGTYTVSFTVEDNNGATDTHTTIITVAANPTNQAPTATFTINDEDEPTFVFTSTSVDLDGTVDAFEWTVDGTVVSTDATYTHIFTEDGTHTVMLRVTDNEGATDTEIVEIEVNTNEEDPETGITVNAGSGITVEVDETVEFDGIASDSNGYIDRFEWDFDGDGDFDYSSSVNGETTHEFDEQGTYYAVFRVRDDDGNLAEDTRRIVVGEEEGRPEVNAGNDKNAETLEELEFSGTASDDDGFIVKYEWDFNYSSTDGFDVDYTSTRDASTTHVYYKAGTYKAALRATDDEGKTQIDWIYVRVSGEDIDDEDTEGQINYDFHLKAFDVRRTSEYDFEDATTTVKLKITNLDDKDRSLLVRDVIPKDFAEYYDDFDVTPNFDIIYNTDPELGWNITVGAYETAYIEYTFYKFIGVEDMEDQWEKPTITEYSPEEIAEPVNQPTNEETNAGITGLVFGAMDAAGLSIYAVIIIVLLILAFWKKDWIVDKFGRQQEEDEE